MGRFRELYEECVLNEKIQKYPDRDEFRNDEIMGGNFKNASFTSMDIQTGSFVNSSFGWCVLRGGFYQGNTFSECEFTNGTTQHEKNKYKKCKIYAGTFNKGNIFTSCHIDCSTGGHFGNVELKDCTFKNGYVDGATWDGSYSNWKKGTWQSGFIHSVKFNELIKSNLDPVKFGEIEEIAGSLEKFKYLAVGKRPPKTIKPKKVSDKDEAITSLATMIGVTKYIKKFKGWFTKTKIDPIKLYKDINVNNSINNALVDVLFYAFDDGSGRGNSSEKKLIAKYK